MNYYDKINWKNRSEGKTTKISAERLNHMDNQIFNNANAIGNVEKIADIGDGTLCGAAETLKETAEKLTQSLEQLPTLLFFNELVTKKTVSFNYDENYKVLYLDFYINDTDAIRLSCSKDVISYQRINKGVAIWTRNMSWTFKDN